jgi:hypothetical protein
MLDPVLVPHGSFPYNCNYTADISCCPLRVSNGLTKWYILWRIDPFLGNDHETNNEITPVAIQQIPNKRPLNSSRLTVFSMRSVQIRCNHDN